jgi:hypothetical protein
MKVLNMGQLRRFAACAIYFPINSIRRLSAVPEPCKSFLMIVQLCSMIDSRHSIQTSVPCF